MSSTFWHKVNCVLASVACSLAAFLLVAWIATALLMPGNLPDDPDFHFDYAMQAVTSMARGMVVGAVAAVIAFVLTLRFLRRRYRRSS